MIKMTGSGDQTTYIYWAFKTSWQDSIALNGCLKTWDAGYNIFGSNDRPAPDKNIIQLKIDSAGIVPGCIARITENFSIARNNFPGDTSAYNYVTDSMVPYAYSIAGYNMLSLDTTIFCKELKCPFLPLADTCVKSFFRLYQGYNPLNISEGITEINGAIYIGGGDNQLDYHPNSGNSFILKLNSDGHILKQRNYLIGDGNFGYLRKGNDSTLILYGEMDSAYYYYSFVAKVDTNLNISWIKILPFGIYPTSPNTFNIVDVKQYSDGSYFALVYEEYGIIYHRTLLIKLNANGGFIWTKSYTFPPPSGGYNQIVGSKLAINGGDVYVLCSNRYNNIAESILLKVDQNNGNVFWCKKFADPDDRLDISDLMSVYNNEIFFSGIVGQYPYKNVILKTDLNGNVIQAISHAIPNSSSTLRYSSTQNTDGTLSLVCDFYPANVYPFINKTGCDIKLDANLAIRYSRERPFAYLRDRDYLVSAADQSLYETGYILSPYQQSSQTNFYLMKYSPDGNLGVCPSDTFVFTVTPVPITVSSVNYIQSDTVFNVRTPFSYATQQHYMAEARQICSSVQGCDTLKIQGQDTICNNIAVFNAYRNSGCNAPVQWDIDQSEAQVIYSDDSIIYLQFLKTGNIKLYATLYSNCMPLKDSLKIYVLSSPPTLNLGPDTILCNNAAIILNAHKGFKTYLWQDGSVDSVFTVTAGGLYFVTVTDSCNNVFADSIIVSPDSYTPFDLGPDTAKCNKDTILLQINSGFNNYLWSPIVNMIFVTPTIVKVFPNNTMYYYVTARKANGCILKDSIKIIVNLSPIINLGADTSICRGDSLKLNAGGGFLNYLWSTGQNTSIIYVKTVGLYYVLATDANNCSSKDSLSILQLFPSPALHLSNDSLICTGQNKIFDAGPGFSSYLWNTGSTRRTISISSIGDYWVRVYDSKGCKNSDTIHIRQQQLPPSRFLLFSDTTLCQYDTISIKANRIFSSYLWSTGSSQPVITTSVPGLYWLQVTDQEGCIGKDTTTIMPKDCYKKIYFPNSFTPNQDGINDIYKPKIFGYLGYYHIIIYNRWGQKVFESFDPNRGWDGDFKVLKQEYGAFVWECSYQFKDEKMQFKQGTFLLLR